jgi:REP element-mobilizing transposase RayT
MSNWKITKEASIYFVTTTIVNWYPVFTSKSYFQLITDSLQYCRRNKGLNIHSYVIMLNHVHLLASVEDDDPKILSSIFRDLKRFTSNEITKKLREDSKNTALSVFKRAAKNDERGNHYKVWQDGFHPKAVLKEQFGKQKLDYIHKNPVRKGYVLEPSDWRYSSAGYYSGQSNYELEIDDIFS